MLHTVLSAVLWFEVLLCNVSCVQLGCPVLQSLCSTHAVDFLDQVGLGDDQDVVVALQVVSVILPALACTGMVSAHSHASKLRRARMCTQTRARRRPQLTSEVLLGELEFCRKDKHSTATTSEVSERASGGMGVGGGGTTAL